MCDFKNQDNPVLSGVQVSVAPFAGEEKEGSGGNSFSWVLLSETWVRQGLTRARPKSNTFICDVLEALGACVGWREEPSTQPGEQGGAG